MLRKIFTADNKEYTNFFFKACIDPLLLLFSFFNFLQRICRFFERRLQYGYWYYPGEIKQAAAVCNEAKENCSWFFQSSGNPQNSNVGHSGRFSVDTIKIASGICPTEGNSVPWTKHFYDQEDVFSLHRWNFLLTLITDKTANPDLFEWGRKQIKDWLCRFLDKQCGQAWMSYTVGERICNGILFYYCHEAVPESCVTNGLAVFADFLCSHLEYKGRYFTGNHVINNSRALYFAGRVLKINKWSRIARLVIKREISEMVTAHGFLREGSSHYQFLFTRWILEIYWLAARTKDMELCSTLKPWLIKLLKSCWFFLIWQPQKEKYIIPLIGDISPDFIPEWLMDAPWSWTALDVYQPSGGIPRAPEKGWAGLLGRNEGDNGVCSQAERIQRYDSSGWYRIDYGDAVLILRVDPQGTPDYPCHAHNDSGSFCLFIKGNPFVIDPGRMNYCMDEFSRYGVSGLSHSTVTVDGFETHAFLHRRAFSRRYRCSRTIIGFREIPDGIEISQEIRGFSRLVKGKIHFIRVLKIGSNILNIKDVFTGTGVHEIKSRIHFSPDIHFNNGSYEFTSPFGQGYVKIPAGADAGLISGEKEDIGGWSFPQYGQKIKTHTMVISTKNKLPVQLDYALGWRVM
ncbi:MAG: heparinase II/III-family protein [bacterium]